MIAACLVSNILPFAIPAGESPNEKVNNTVTVEVLHRVKESHQSLGRQEH